MSSGMAHAPPWTRRTGLLLRNSSERIVSVAFGRGGDFWFDLREDLKLRTLNRNYGDVFLSGCSGGGSGLQLC
jgi:hypothetical protein